MNIINQDSKAKEDLTLMQSLKKFYFTSKWHSLLTIPYLFLFLYFAIAYFDNILSAIGFIFRTFTISTTFMPMTTIIWGAIYEIVLVMPFVISLIMILILPNIWKNIKWKKDQKIVITIISFVIAMFLMSIVNDLREAVINSGTLETFLGINISV